MQKRQSQMQIYGNYPYKDEKESQADDPGGFCSTQ
jgi:hypothetical protein